MKKSIILLALALMIILSACANDDTGDAVSDVSSTEVTSVASDESSIESAEETTSQPETTSAPESESETTSPTSPPAQNNTSKATGGNTQSTTSSRPPANNGTPSQASVNPPQESPPPTTSTPTEPPKPAYTETDYQEIISTIRAYGESKNFVWNDSFVFDQAGLGYYGRPNLTTLSKQGVITDLKFNCDTIEREVGICYFKVVKQVYQGNVEFIVLYG